MKDQLKFLKRAADLALKSGCLRAKTGAVIVKSGQVLVETFNQVLPKNSSCLGRGCLRDKLRLGLGKEAEKCRSVHAEARAICLAAQKGICLSGATAYLTCQPCVNCAKLLYCVGVKAVYYLDRHADQTGEVFLKKMGLKCQKRKLRGDVSGKRLRDSSFQGEKST
ncbi:cytidine/deoxycytidylate deaminase family protein [Patescibacteria group bacterium]